MCHQWWIFRKSDKHLDTWECWSASFSTGALFFKSFPLKSIRLTVSELEFCCSSGRIKRRKNDPLLLCPSKVRLTVSLSDEMISRTDNVLSHQSLLEFSDGIFDRINPFSIKRRLAPEGRCGKCKVINRWNHTAWSTNSTNSIRDRKSLKTSKGAE